jgi:type I restriction-modification system DNA methylase subunit
MARAKSKESNRNNSANTGFETKLWLAADKLRSNMDAAEYKHVVLGLIFLKYISDSFEEHHAKLAAGKGDYAGADPEDQDEYKAQTSSGFHPPPIGHIFKTAPSRRKSARSSTTRWSPSSATTRV